GGAVGLVAGVGRGRHGSLSPHTSRSMRAASRALIAPKKAPTATAESRVPARYTAAEDQAIHSATSLTMHRTSAAVATAEVVNSLVAVCRSPTRQSPFQSIQFRPQFCCVRRLLLRRGEFQQKQGGAVQMDGPHEVDRLLVLALAPAQTAHREGDDDQHP